MSQPVDLGVPDGHRRSRLVMCSSRFLMCWGGSESGDTLTCSNNAIQDSSKWMNMVRLWMYFCLLILVQLILEVIFHGDLW